MNSTFIPLWLTNTTRETNDDYANLQEEQEIQQTILNHQRQGDQSETNLNSIHYSQTGQMGDNIITSNDQRQYSAGGNGSNSSNVANRKKGNNGKQNPTDFSFHFVFFSSSIGTGGDLTASPKYNKSNSRGYNKEIQQQKQSRGTNNREQRGGGNSRYRNSEQHSSYRVRREKKRISLYEFRSVE